MGLGKREGVCASLFDTCNVGVFHGLGNGVSSLSAWLASDVCVAGFLVCYRRIPKWV